jgi:hypothetical protein
MQKRATKKSPLVEAYESADAHWRELASAEFRRQVSWWTFGLQGAGKPNTPLRTAFMARLEAWDAMQAEKGK